VTATRSDKGCPAASENCSIDETESFCCFSSTFMESAMAGKDIFECEDAELGRFQDPQ
jgi:hypothetical protein